jgi:hypothetical protein
MFEGLRGVAKVHRSEFLKKLKDAFPEVGQGINQPHSKPGNIGSEMDYFRRFVQKLIDDGDRGQVKKAYELAVWAYENGNNDLRSAIDSIFLEEMSFEDTNQNKRRWARELLPPALAKPYEDWLKILHGETRKKE